LWPPHQRQLITGPRHLALVLREYVEHYNADRPHRPHRSLINIHQRAGPLHRLPTARPGHCGETASAAISTNTCRPHDMTGFSAPTGWRLDREVGRVEAAVRRTDVGGDVAVVAGPGERSGPPRLEIVTRARLWRRAAGECRPVRWATP
jgi:hypothetical protein